MSARVTSPALFERTVVIASELHKLFLQRLEDGVKGVNRGLVGCVLLIELDCFFGRHGVVFGYVEARCCLYAVVGLLVLSAYLRRRSALYIRIDTRICQDDSMNALPRACFGLAVGALTALHQQRMTAHQSHRSYIHWRK